MGNFFSTPELRQIDKELVKYANYLIYRTAKDKTSPYDEDLINSVTFSEWWAQLLTTQARVLFLDGHPLAISRMCEFYIAVLLRAEWEPTKGSDVRRIIEYYTEGLKIATFEVRHCSPCTGGARKRWAVRVTDSNNDFRADFVTAVMLPEDLNPCYGQLFCFPKHYLIDRAGSGVLSIKQKMINRWTKDVNAHWQYYISDYRTLEKNVLEHCTYKEPNWAGHFSLDVDPLIVSEQLSLFRIMFNKVAFVKHDLRGRMSYESRTLFFYMRATLLSSPS